MPITTILHYIYMYIYNILYRYASAELIPRTFHLLFVRKDKRKSKAKKLKSITLHIKFTWFHNVYTYMFMSTKMQRIDSYENQIKIHSHVVAPFKDFDTTNPSGRFKY